MSSREEAIKDLKLFGEHINLSSRTRFNDDVKRFRPQSALYSSNKYTLEHNRRPFSAGTEPTSPKLQSFLRHTQTDRTDILFMKNSEYFKDLPIPGTVESSSLCDRLIKEPINRIDLSKEQYYYDKPEQQSTISDNNSENGSLETCISLGTKIKARAQTSLSGDSYSIAGNSIQLKKYRPLLNTPTEHYFDNEMIKRSLNVIPEKDSGSKLSIHLPISKDDNTSSGVSSSSDTLINQNKKDVDNQYADIFPKDIPLLQRLRAKRTSNLPLNLFSKNIEKESDNLNYDIKNKDNNNLAGRVSFAKTQYEDEDIIDDIDNAYDIFSNFDNQLSLVEEESSQDSDKSIDHVVLNEYSNKIIGDNSHNDIDLITKTDISKYLKSDNHDMKKSSLNTRSIDLKSDSRMRKSFEDDEKEMKFKALENKYKNEKSYYDNSSVNMKSQENFYNNSDYHVDPHSNHSKQTVSTTKSDRLTTNSTLENKYLPDSMKIDFQIDDIVSKYYKSDEIYVENEKQSNNFEESDLFKSEKDTKRSKSSLSTRTRSSMDLDEDKIKRSVTVKDSISTDKVKENVLKFEDNEEKKAETAYPKYLEESETKSYTSKVIEEYKQEIASINNFHDLTLQDIRSKCDNFKTTMNFDKNINKKNSVRLSTSTSDDEIDCISASENNKDKQKIFKHQSMITLNEWRKNFNSSETFVQDISKFPTSFSNVLKNKNRNEEDKYRTIKPRRKLKKKEQPIETKSKNITDDAKFKKTYVKRKDCDSKKCKDDIYLQKSNKNMNKLKTHKITLTKSKTKINHTVYFDNDVVSWMGTRINTPLGEMSSCENTERNKIIFDEKTHEKEKLVHFEDDILPVTKLSSKVTQMDDNQFENDSHTATTASNSQSIAILEDFVRTPDINSEKLCDRNDEDNYKNRSSTHIDDVNCKTTEEIVEETADKLSEINNIFNDDTMISDIYSTLQDIENQSKSRDKNIISANSTFVNKDEGTNIEYRDIASYLEKVERSANEDMSTLSHNQPLFALKVEELMELSKAELAHRAIVGVLSAGRASAVASSLRDALTEAAKVSAGRLKAAKASAKQEATIIAAQTAQTISKHQKFIEQLVNEKKILTDRIEELAGTAAGAEARRGRAARAAAERLQLELRNQRQRLNAVHQRDKQAWLKHHTQKIKEMTVKELECELKEIEKKHTYQIMKVQQDADLVLSELKDQHMKEIRKLKDTAARQLEDELDKERLLATERLEQKRLEWEAAMANAVERAAQESRDANRRAEEMVKNARHQADLWKIEQEEEISKQRILLEKEVDEKKNILKEEYSMMRENLIKEFENCKKEYSNKQIMMLKEKEAEIRLMLKRERDREIEKAIDCMEMEAQEGKKDMQEAIKKMKDEYEMMKVTLENSEKSAIQRYNELKEKFIEVQEQCSHYQINISKLEGKLKQAEEINAQNAMQTDLLIKAAEFRGQENLKDLQSQLDNAQQKHKDEMHQLFAKVKIVIARKDEALALARREAANLRERCIRLEAKYIPN